MRPSVVSASKSGATSLIWSDMTCFLLVRVARSYWLTRPSRQTCLACTVNMCRVFSRAHCSHLVQILKRRRCPKIDRLGNLLWDGHFRARLVAWRCWRYSFCTARRPTSATFVGGAFDQKIRTRKLRTILPRGHGGGN